MMRQAEKAYLQARPTLTTATRTDDAASTEQLKLVVEWGDKHVSEFPIDWLMHYALKSRGGQPQSKYLWQAKDFTEEVRQLPQLDVHEIMHGADKEGVRQWLSLLTEYGFVIVNGVANDVESMRSVIERIAPVQQSLFGDVWDITQREAEAAWNAEHRDTAYSNDPIGPHTDGCYSWAPPGVQFFQIATTARLGGTNYFVDGFKLAETFRTQHPNDYRLLTDIPISYHYDDCDLNHHMQATRPIFQHDETGNILRVHFNDYDRLPFACHPDQIEEFYSAYGRLLELVNSQENHLRLHLRPDQLLATDNWRVLHAREGFSGNRRLMGAYIERDAITRVILGAEK